MPCGRLMIASSSFRWSAAKPMSARPRSTEERSRRRMVTRSPFAVGAVATRMSMSLPAILRRMRPSCGSLFSAMFKPAMILTRERIDARYWRVRACGLAEHAVDPVADDDVLLAGLDVDIRRALLHRLEDEGVHPADDRRLVGEVEDVDELLGVAELVVLAALRLELDADLELGVDL